LHNKSTIGLAYLQTKFNIPTPLSFDLINSKTHIDILKQKILNNKPAVEYKSLHFYFTPFSNKKSDKLELVSNMSQECEIIYQELESKRDALCNNAA
jgi:hypothetical protein